MRQRIHMDEMAEAITVVKERNVMMKDQMCISARKIKCTFLVLDIGMKGNRDKTESNLLFCCE